MRFLKEQKSMKKVKRHTMAIEHTIIVNYNTLCAMRSALCPLRYAPCALPSALALCPMPFALCAISQESYLLIYGRPPFTTLTTLNKHL